MQDELISDAVDICCSRVSPVRYCVPCSKLYVVAVSETWKMEEFLALTKEHSLVKKGRALGATGYVLVTHCSIPKLNRKQLSSSMFLLFNGLIAFYGI